MLAAIADGDIDGRAVEIGILMGRFDAQRRCGIAPFEIRQRRDQHRAGEEGQGANPKLAAAVAPMPQHLAAGFLQRCQRA
jgi:hypothetical protein